MKINTIFGDHNTAIVEIQLSDLQTLINAAKFASQSIVFPGGNITLNNAIKTVQGALIDNDLNETRAEVVADIYGASTLQQVYDIVDGMAGAYIDNLPDLHHTMWNEAAINRGSQVMASIMSVASRRVNEIVADMSRLPV